MAKLWGPHDEDEEVDAAAVDHSQIQEKDVTQQKDVVVAAVDVKIFHEALRDAQGEDGWRGQDEDGGHDHQHPGQGHLT